MNNNSFLSPRDKMRICITLDKEIVWWAKNMREDNKEFNLSKIVNNLLERHKVNMEKKI